MKVCICDTGYNCHCKYVNKCQVKNCDNAVFPAVIMSPISVDASGMPTLFTTCWKNHIQNLSAGVKGCPAGTSILVFNSFEDAIKFHDIAWSLYDDIYNKIFKMEQERLGNLYGWISLTTAGNWLPFNFHFELNKLLSSCTVIDLKTFILSRGVSYSDII